MVDTYNLIAGIFSIAGAIITAWLCYKIYQFNRLSKAWLAAVWAFILIVIRRAIGFLNDFKIFPDYIALLKSIEYTLLIAISLLYIIGFWSLLRNFENFEIVEKKIKSKIKNK